MKTANFKYHGPDANNPAKRPSVTIFGKVTVKDDGKVTISIHNPKEYSFGNKYAAKQYANAIVNSGFSMGEVYDIVDTNSSSNLAGILMEKTKDLHDEFIVRAKTYAREYFKRATKKLSQRMELWYDEFGVKYVYNEPQTYSKSTEKVLAPDSKEYNRKGYYKMLAARKTLHDLVHKTGVEKFEETEVKHAENHYHDSIIKLAGRLRDKGVTLENAVIKSAKIKQNFEITIDCKGVITRAWTIIASGPVQRPHYRYLVK